ncbi:MAG: cupredoxin domain-containing protein, partial [Patescibacteria group bacterium]
GIRKGLELGENIFEFTPKETGTIRFSCIMGMYTGSFNVVDESSTTSFTPLQEKAPIAQNQATSGAGASCSANGGGCGCGGGAKKQVTATAGETTKQGEVQLLKATYTSLGDIKPNNFTVNANQPVRFEIDAKEDGQGCMGSVTIPTLTKKVEVFTKGEKTVFEFTPTSKGSFPITCAMGVPRGQIQVI